MEPHSLYVSAFPKHFESWCLLCVQERLTPSMIQPRVHSAHEDPHLYPAAQLTNRGTPHPSKTSRNLCREAEPCFRILTLKARVHFGHPATIDLRCSGRLFNQCHNTDGKKIVSSGVSAGRAEKNQAVQKKQSGRTENNRAVQKRIKPCRKRSSRAENDRAVQKSIEPCRNQSSRAEIRNQKSEIRNQKLRTR